MQRGKAGGYFKTMNTLEKPRHLHREITPARECPDCGAWLTSANIDGEGCSLHGGWVKKPSPDEERADLYAELEELMSA